MEEWKDIEGYEGLYQVSNLGRIRSGDTYIRPYVSKDDSYVRVGLGAGVTKTVHRLVAHAFIPNPNNLPEVNHLDRVKHHNMAMNLEWCTRQENIDHAAQAKSFCFKNRVTGEVVSGVNVKKFAESRGLLAASLSKVTKGIRPVHKDWIKWQ